jgi:alpha-L-fucosidase
MPIRNQQLRRLRRREVPAWWRDAKLGIFVHWTIASVPAFAPVDVDFEQLIASRRSEAFGWSPYVEWYENSLRFEDSPVSRHHRDVYGDRPYEDFRDEWEAGLEQWDPDSWAKRFAASGARYVVLVSKHADGYCLWPTDVPNPRRPGWNSTRDVVGELAEAVRGAGMRFGLYYSGGMDWRFDDRPMGSMADVLAGVPRADYPAYAQAQVRELIGRYRPSVLWNDIAWPAPGKQLWPLFEHYYELVPDGVVNDRWMPWSPLFAATRTTVGGWAIDSAIERQTRRDGGLVPPPAPHFDVRTPEYAVFPGIQRTAWECVRGMDHSFGYNAFSQPKDFIEHGELLWLLTDIVAKGGNLLLNVGPRGADAQIPDEQLTRLGWLGEWVGENRRALMETRPWIRPGTTVGRDTPVRYTARGDTVFAFLRDATGSVLLPDVTPTPTSEIETVDGQALTWKATPEGVSIDLPGGAGGPRPMVVAMRNVEAR